MQVQPTAMVSMTARWRQGPGRGGGGQRRRRTGTWLKTGTLTMLRSSCMVKGFTQPRHRHLASGRSAGMRLGSWLMLRGASGRGREVKVGGNEQGRPLGPCLAHPRWGSHSKTGKDHLRQVLCPRGSRSPASASFLLAPSKIPIPVLVLWAPQRGLKPPSAPWFYFYIWENLIYRNKMQAH